jgi:hypothetical protein
MEVSDRFGILGVIRAYLGELADEEIPLTSELQVSVVLVDLCRLAGVAVPLEVEAGGVSNLVMLPAQSVAL